MPRTDRQPRQRLDAHTRRAGILAAAAVEFARAPYEEVSVAHVAAAASASEALVFRYFGSKPQLYASVIRWTMDELVARQASADDALPPGSSARDRVRTALLVYLDFLAERAMGWAASFVVAGNDPAAAVAVRREVRAEYVDRLGELLGLAPATGPGRLVRDEFALWGYFGFLDGACLAWVDRGCPVTERDSLVDAALGALEGALGDWRR